MSRRFKGILGERDHRPYPMPAGRPVMRMSWCELLFAHWRVEPGVIKPFIPDGLEVDTFDGAAWVAVVPFRMADTAPYGLPNVPGTHAFDELNVRTYVRTKGGDHDGRPGVWFFSLDAASWLAVKLARFWFGLNYVHARMSCVRRDGWIEYRSERKRESVDGAATFRGRYRPTGEPFLAERGSLEHWLTERYCLYALRRGRVMRGEVHHVQWPLREAEAEIEVNTMTQPAGIELVGEPHLLYADRIDVLGWGPGGIA